MIYERDHTIIGVSHLPGHKKPSLIVGNEYAYKAIASFNSEYAANEFDLYMRTLFKGMIRSCDIAEAEDNEH